MFASTGTGQKNLFLNEEFLFLEPQADDKLFPGGGEQFFYSTFKGSDNLMKMPAFTLRPF